MRRTALGATLAALLVLPGLAAAQAPDAFPGGSVIAAVEKLKPGEYLWTPEIAPEGPLLLIVSIARQRAILYRNGVPIAVTTVSTGRDGYPTPTGVFTILQKAETHFSSIYDNAPMPFMQRLTWGGVALHGGQLPGYRASHGCIRLPHSFAKLLFGVTTLGMTVIVSDARALPRLAPTRDPLPIPDAALGGAEWQPGRAATGPVTIMVSAADRRIVVLRNGREIGTAPIAFNQPVSGTRAYVLRAGADGKPGWLSIPLPGEEKAPAPPIDWSRFRVDPGFRAEIVRVAGPGTTVVVTADSLVTGAPPVDLLEAVPSR